MEVSSLQMLPTHGTFPWRHREGPEQTRLGWKGFVPPLSAHPLPPAASKEGAGLALPGQAH